MENKPKISIIVAVAENGVIGSANGLPWKIRSEMLYFMHTTMGKPVVMGRKTFETLGKPLKDRTNIIITRDRAYKANGARIVHTLEEALTIARQVCAETGATEIMICGGAEVYKQALEISDTLYLTIIHSTPDGDTVFPEFDKNEWQEVESERHPAKEGESADYTVTISRRIKHK